MRPLTSTFRASWHSPATERVSCRQVVAVVVLACHDRALGPSDLGVDVELTAEQLDRARGVLVGQACGDALGVPYEFVKPPAGEPQMVGGGLGPYAPGEWSDDTQMSICIARVAATGADLTSQDALDEIAAGFEDWLASGATDVGAQTRSVLHVASRSDGRPNERLRAASFAHFERTGRAAGNGALMRTGIVGLTRLGDRDHTAASARAVAELTHADPLAGESCILWSEAIRVAVLTGELDLTDGLDLLPTQRRSLWGDIISAAEATAPQSFSPNGFTVTALQAAWAAICSTAPGDGPSNHLRSALTAAVHIGDDTDTVAAIAGALLGGRYGLAAIPATWCKSIHGWPGAMRAASLESLASNTALCAQTVASAGPPICPSA